MDQSTQKGFFNWSTGKDSALALYKILNSEEYCVSGLLTTINDGFGRVSMHGIRKELLYQQVERIQLPLFEVLLPEVPTMESYEKAIGNALQERITSGDKISIFGDIFLEDLRKYRADKLAEIGLKAHFPLWKKNTKELVKELISLGFKAIVVCVNTSYLGEEFLGKIIDEDFLESLPENVDPCGENGEYHTFVFDGPIFSNPVQFEVGEKVYRTYQSPLKKENSEEYDCSSDEEIKSGFWYLDLIPLENK
jgi:uncharacterized protein (TIGR00290 family)